ncbi:hypothetical protein VPNG_10260 [Cytospora leucostoma]|uniref:Major facilitator superfamily (MFS) profile domain-containing protein n=1 Tax=Cytospora leucostoma TaxID=1230097 RepID=A0A423VE48_9PEZI|nr:hypothetical protein VPNG_10260 [Cytospora leucostoma]
MAPQASFIAPAASASAPSSSTTSSRPRPRPRPGLARPVRLYSAGSFHAGAPPPSFNLPKDPSSSKTRKRSFLSHLRRQSTHRYHTFPTQPPKTPSDTPDSATTTLSPHSYPGHEDDDDDDAEYDQDDDGHGAKRNRGSVGGNNNNNNNKDATPLPWKQLALLALLSLAEQTALNSIGPYLPTMVAAFPEIPDGQAGLYVGLLASAFAMAQLMTNFLWGYFSDRVGRKPIMLIGTALLALCFAFFGFCARYWQALVVHIAMGLLNGNAAVVPTVLGEVTDRSNQSRAFTWLPVMYSIGGITGPALGGLLVGEPGGRMRWPFLGPNVLSAALLLAAVVVLGLWFDETLDEADRRDDIKGLVWLEKLFRCSCFSPRKGRQGSWSSRWPASHRAGVAVRREGADAGDEDEDEDEGTGEDQALLDHDHRHDPEAQDGAEHNKDAALSRRSTLRQILNWTTLSILLTYLIFQVVNISFNSLYPIFASAPPPTGRDLGPSVIGVSMSLAGLVTILFQVSLFEPLKARLGNLGTFRLSLLGLAISMVLAPWVGYQDDDGLLGWGTGRTWLLVELGVVLVLKNLSAVGGLSCVLLLITNSAPSHETLGTLNGIAQTLSAAGRSFGPFASGGLFTLSMRLQPKGELLAWGLFGGFALVGWVWTMFIRGGKLESDDYVGDDGNGAESDGDETDEDYEEYEQRQDISERLRGVDDNGRAISDIEE